MRRGEKAEERREVFSTYSLNMWPFNEYVALRIRDKIAIFGNRNDDF